MIICGTDLETSGLKIGQARILQIACALYCTKSRSIFDEFSMWVWDESYPPSSVTALAVNGLNDIWLKVHGRPPKEAFQKVLNYFDKADAVIAHNGNSFDRPLLEFELEQFGLTKRDKVWIDTRTDIDYPDFMQSRRLQHLAIDHGIIVTKAHRALNDVHTMLDIAKNYNLEKVFERAKSPAVKIQAVIEFEEVNKRTEAKTNRFNWDRENKIWWKMIREIDYEKEASSLSFEIRRI